jgi:hypothetical protein
MTGPALRAGGPSRRMVEIGVAAVMLVFGAIVIYGSWQVGISWAVEGPQAGFFPFYIGLIIVGASLMNLVRALALPGGVRFADWAQLRRVGSVIVPAAIYVAVIPPLGIYVASALLIGVFMKWIGRYGWLATIALAVALPLVALVVFERWFLIPLPKGPLEEALGF